MIWLPPLNLSCLEETSHLVGEEPVSARPRLALGSNKTRCLSWKAFWSQLTDWLGKYWQYLGANWTQLSFPFYGHRDHYPNKNWYMWARRDFSSYQIVFLKLILCLTRVLKIWSPRLGGVAQWYGVCLGCMSSPLPKKGLGLGLGW